jgi:hypothetical protein
MLKLGIIGLAAILVVVAGLYGAVRYTQLHATEPDSFSSKVYQRALETKLLDRCRALVNQHTSLDDVNTPQQYDAMCKCYASDIFARFRNVPPDELDAAMQKEENTTSALSIITKCIHQSGLN